MPLKLNMFRLKKPLSEIDIDVSVYKVVNIGYSKDKFKILGNIKYSASNFFNSIATTYSPSSGGDYILVFNPEKCPDECEIDSFTLKFEEKNKLEKFVNPAKRLFYELTRLKLEYHGFWRVGYNKYYSLNVDNVIKGKFDEYKVYRGLFFRYEILDNQPFLVIDPITRVVTKDSLWTVISKFGESKVKEILEKEERYVVASQVRGKIPTFSVKKAVTLRTDLRAGKDKIISVEGKKYTIKEYYSDYKELPEIAEMIDDDEPLIEVEGGYWYAPSMAHLVMRTKDLEEDIDEVKEEVYLTPERRFGQTQRFLKVVNPLSNPKYPTIPKLEFKETPESFDDSVFEPPDLLFGNEVKNLKSEGFDNYTSFLKGNLKKHGPAKPLPALSANDRIAIVYPREYLTENHVKGFYMDVSRLSKTYFRASLPRWNRVYLWEYTGNDTTEVYKNYNEFRDLVRAVICILRYKDDELYFEFKDAFQDKPCQMGTKDLILKKYDLPEEKRHIYFNSVLNLACGLLGKMGARPWLLARKMKGDLYLGIDTKPGKIVTFVLVNANGDYVVEARYPIKKLKVDGEIVRDAIVKLVLSNLKLLPRDREGHIVIHRDGDFYESEKRGVELAKKALKEKNLSLTFSLISIKESTPYRIFYEKNNKKFSCAPGSFVELSDNIGVLASVGWPLIKQGLAQPLLIEIVRNERGDYSLNDALNEVYSLSFLHWEGIVKKLKMPITIEYADEYSVFAERGIDVIGPPL